MSIYLYIGLSWTVNISTKIYQINEYGPSLNHKDMVVVIFKCYAIRMDPIHETINRSHKRDFPIWLRLWQRDIRIKNHYMQQSL